MGLTGLAAASNHSGGGSELKQQTCAGDSLAAVRWGFSSRGAKKRVSCVYDVVMCVVCY
jgi:hypothetical protein